MYSVSFVLLEIGLWQLFIDAWTGKGGSRGPMVNRKIMNAGQDAEKVKKTLIGHTEKAMGQRYADLVMQCLTSLDKVVRVDSS